MSNSLVMATLLLRTVVHEVRLITLTFPHNYISNDCPFMFNLFWVCGKQVLYNG